MKAEYPWIVPVPSSGELMAMFFSDVGDNILILYDIIFKVKT